MSAKHFYPRPPRGGRRFSFVNIHFFVFISIHALREVGDAAAQPDQNGEEDISIHALREEGDHWRVLVVVCQCQISIHALREEGDKRHGTVQRKPNNFYPRPPRGGRHYH